jgi:hypothetical protein
VGQDNERTATHKGCQQAKHLLGTQGVPLNGEHCSAPHLLELRNGVFFDLDGEGLLGQETASQEVLLNSVRSRK